MFLQLERRRHKISANVWTLTLKYWRLESFSSLLFSFSPPLSLSLSLSLSCLSFPFLFSKIVIKSVAASTTTAAAVVVYLLLYLTWTYLPTYVCLSVFSFHPFSLLFLFLCFLPCPSLNWSFFLSVFLSTHLSEWTLQRIGLLMRILHWIVKSQSGNRIRGKPGKRASGNLCSKFTFYKWHFKSILNDCRMLYELSIGLIIKK